MADLGVVVTPSLLQWDGPLTRSKDAHSHFQLGLGDWTVSEDDKENAAPNEELRRKKKKLDEVSKECWEFLTEAAEYNLRKKHIASQWVHGNFMEWKSSRNQQFASDPEKQVLDKLLECTSDPAVLCTQAGLYIEAFLADYIAACCGHVHPHTVSHCTLGLVIILYCCVHTLILLYSSFTKNFFTLYSDTLHCTLHTFYCTFYCSLACLF